MPRSGCNTASWHQKQPPASVATAVSFRDDRSDWGTAHLLGLGPRVSARRRAGPGRAHPGPRRRRPPCRRGAPRSNINHPRKGGDPARFGIRALSGGGGVRRAAGGGRGAVLRWRRGSGWAQYYLIAALAGWGPSSALKALFARPRPTVTTHLDGAGWWSFPSGHTMESTVVLGLGILLVTGWMRNRAAARLARVITAAVLTAIGLSRAYLGVHYPSDVLAGWLAGGAWISGMLAFFSAGRAELHPPSPPGTS